MIERTFRLIPFPAPDLPAVSIAGTLSLESGLLSLHYSLSGNIKEVLLPPESVPPRRRDELWKATCFEFFLAIQDQPGYWEFNMSPSGDWNVYRMDAYRRIGFREEPAISQLPFRFRKGMDGVFLDVSLDLTPMIQPGDALEVALSAILQTKDSGETYWALVHPGIRADFHARESFIVLLGGQIQPSVQSAPDD
jgi:hypothetical protein